MTVITSQASIDQQELERWPQGAAWMTFVVDHLRELLASAETVQLTPGEWNKYRYRPARLLADRGYDATLDWLLLLANDLRSNCEFSDQSIVRVIPSVALQGIRSRFVSQETT